MDKYIIASDLHCNPIIDSERKRKILQFKRYCDKSNMEVILAGDIFDSLEFGWKKILENDFCADMFEWTTNKIYLEGNHDRTRPDGSKAYKYAIVDSVYISHWHQFDLLWGFLPLDTFWLPDWLIRTYKTPAKVKEGMKGLDYHLMTAQVEYVAMHFLFKNFYDALIGGHTHSQFYMEREGCLLANCGDFVDSMTFAELDIFKLDIKIKSLDDI